MDQFDLRFSPHEGIGNFFQEDILEMSRSRPQSLQLARGFNVVDNNISPVLRRIQSNESLNNSIINNNLPLTANTNPPHRSLKRQGSNEKIKELTKRASLNLKCFKNSRSRQNSSESNCSPTGSSVNKAFFPLDGYSNDNSPTIFHHSPQLNNFSSPPHPYPLSPINKNIQINSQPNQYPHYTQINNQYNNNQYNNNQYNNNQYNNNQYHNHSIYNNYNSRPQPRVPPLSQSRSSFPINSSLSNRNYNRERENLHFIPEINSSNSEESTDLTHLANQRESITFSPQVPESPTLQKSTGTSSASPLSPIQTYRVNCSSSPLLLSPVLSEPKEFNNSPQPELSSQPITTSIRSHSLLNSNLSPIIQNNNNSSDKFQDLSIIRTLDLSPETTNESTSTSPSTSSKDHQIEVNGSAEEIIPYEELVKINSSKNYDNLQKDKLETYLSTNEFFKIFSLTKEEFYSLPKWKQQSKKKIANLF